MLEADNKISLEDPITQYLPQYSKLKNIIIQDMVYMRAGFNDAENKNPSPLDYTALRRL